MGVDGEPGRANFEKEVAQLMHAAPDHDSSQRNADATAMTANPELGSLQGYSRLRHGVRPRMAAKRAGESLNTRVHGF
jgi:hypothetical protein